MGKINVYDKIMIENRKKKKIWKPKKFLHKSPSKRSFTNGIYSLLKRADARETADIIDLICDAYSQFAGKAQLLPTSIGHAQKTF